MSSDKIFFSSDLVNSDGSQIGLFDRIINIKFTRKNGESFTLRSDYEPVWLGDKLFFKTCQPKPEIRVQYTQYQGVMINVDIFVTNLHIIESSNGKSNAVTAPSSLTQGNSTNQPNDALTVLGNNIVKAEIEMGYRGQFFNWSRYDSSRPQEAYKAFQDLEILKSAIGSTDSNTELAKSQLLFKAHRKCYVTIEWAVNITNPPDIVTQFHGYVGTPDVGLQPLSLPSLDNLSESGAVGKITKDDILSGLNDVYSAIDEVPFKDTGTKFYPLLTKSKSAYRNFFNGGKGFTLLEAYCFHMITRRFVRSNINMKRNENLEQAAMEYAVGIEYTSTSIPDPQILRNEIEQIIYKKEQVFHPDYFTKTNKEPKKNTEMLIVLNNNVPDTYIKYLEKLINSTMASRYVGPRFTIENLPSYRKLYNNIRQKMSESAAKGEYLSWWQAAEYVNIETAGSIATAEVPFENTIEDARNYTAQLQSNSLFSKDCYFKGIITNDYIVPVQNLNRIDKLKDSKGNAITIKLPTKVSSTGFTTPGAEQPAQCFTGLFEVRDAYMFGVPVLCSEEASKIFQKKHANVSFVETQFEAEAQGQIDWICNTWGLLYYKGHNGAFYIHAKTEDSRETIAQDFVTEQSKTPFRIPAIYDLTLSPMRKIRMPFVSFLDPMTIVEWNSSISIGDMISYYYQPDKGRNFFLAIKNQIDFSTTGDFNTMEIELVDAQWVDTTQVPAVLTSQEVSDKDKNVYTEVIIIPDEQMDSWRKIYESPISTIPVHLCSLWPVVTDPENNISPDLRVPNASFFTSMQAWNQTLFDQTLESGSDGWSWDDSKSRIDKQANKLYGKTRPTGANFPNITYCMSLMVDSEKLKRVYMRFPFMPSSSDYAKMKEYDDKYVLVYQLGVWNMRLKSEISPLFKIGAE